MKEFKKIIGVFVFVMGALFLPNNVLAANMVIKSIQPTTEEEAYSIFDTVNRSLQGEMLIASTCNETYTKCKIQDNFTFETRDVEIEYVYDKDIKKVVDRIVSKLPEDEKIFNLTDMEYINYLLNYDEEAEESINLATYSSELKKFIEYKNFEVEPGRGDDGKLFAEQYGDAQFKYNGTIYSVVNNIGAYAANIIYINDNEIDIEAAIKNKLANVFGDKVKLLRKGPSISDFIDEVKQEYADDYDANSDFYHNIEGYADKDAYVDAKMNQYYYNDDAPMKFLFASNIEDSIYLLQINDEIVPFAVIKDSSKVTDDMPLVTVDANSDITISTTSKSIPLDTLIQVAKLTSGDEYDKIIKILDITNSEMYDLKLFSKTTNDYITKLSDGKFEVKIPISENFKGKKLIAYYVDNDNKITEYEVKEQDGYAVFTTDHFSIYTLAEKKSASNDNSNINNNQPENKNEENTVVDENEVTEQNPQTYDDIMTWVILGLISISGIVGVAIYRKKQNI